jgi:pimeloyl-ACP methyl ester carboxylesterase
VWYGLDVRAVLGSVQAPTLVLCRPAVFPEEGPRPSRYLADRIPGAKYVELSGHDHMIAAGNADEVVAAVGTFLDAIRTEETDFERVLATVLFTDSVGSHGEDRGAR